MTVGALLLSATAALGAIQPGDGIAAGCAATRPNADLGPIVRSTDPVDVELNETTIVSPPLIVVDDPLAAGDTFVCTLTVRNRRSDAVTLKLTPLGMVGSRHGTTGIEFIDDGDDRWNTTAGGWIEPAADTITLPVRGVASIPFRVTVPSEPPVGSAYASLNVVSRAVARAGETSVPIESHVASQLLLRVGGDGVPALKLHDVEAPKLRWNRARWSLTAVLDNDGSLHANTSGRVRLRSLAGNEVATITTRAATVLPDGRAPIAVSWDEVPWLGLYRYDLRVTSDGDPASVATAEGWFVALPPWWVLAILVTMFITLLVRRIRHRHDRWSDHDGSDDDDSSRDGGDFDFELAERQLRD